jgi:hypothetical protein
MGANYVAHLYDLSAPWQRAEFGSRFMGVVSGEPSAALAEGATLAVRCKALHPTDTPADSFRRHASDRAFMRLDPLGTADNDQRREQLRDAWELWRESGTCSGHRNSGGVRGLAGWCEPARARTMWDSNVVVRLICPTQVRPVARDGVTYRGITPETWSQFRIVIQSADVYDDMTATVFDVGVKFGPGFVFGFSVGTLAKARIAAVRDAARATMPAHHMASAIIVTSGNLFEALDNSDALDLTASGGTASTTDAKGYRLI